MGSKGYVLRADGQNGLRYGVGFCRTSVLGPLLFSIFINDLDEDINCNILKFADDTKIFKEVRCSTDCSQLQADLDKLVLWAQKWQMVFNVAKCKVMHVGNWEDSRTHYTEDRELSVVSCEKDLGVWITSFFTLADNTRGIRGRSRKLVKFRCTL